MTRREQLVLSRLQSLHDEVRSGATEMTGKTYRDASGKIAGRFGGGFSTLYPELKRAGMTPGQAALAIEKAEGVGFTRLVRAIKAEVEKELGPEKKRSTGKPTVPPHAGNQKCVSCGVVHAKGQHRFHGEGSFHKTHLFSFHENAMKNPGYGRAFIFLGSYTSKILAAKAERRHPGSFLHFANGRWYVLKPKKIVGSMNPKQRKKLVVIYRRVLSIQAQKLGFHRHCDAECKRVGHKYIHDFKPGAKLLGIPDGSFLMLADGRTLRLSDGSMLVSDKEY